MTKSVNVFAENGTVGSWLSIGPFVVQNMTSLFRRLTFMLATRPWIYLALSTLIIISMNILVNIEVARNKLIEDQVTTPPPTNMGSILSNQAVDSFTTNKGHAPLQQILLPPLLQRIRTSFKDTRQRLS